jgi:TrmH family RNA methyltransferase
MKTVASRDNPAFKAMVKLATSAPERRRRGLTVLDGAHLVGAFLDAGHAVETLMVGRSALELDEVSRLVARVPQSAVIVVADKLFEGISTVDSATGLIAAVAAPAGRPIPADADFVLLLEDVQDPGNVGTLLRSAAAAGVAHVGLSSGCAFAWSLKTVRAGMGAHFRLNIAEDVDLAAFLDRYRGASMALAGDAHHSIYEADLRGPIAVLVGSEGAGISPGLRERADRSLSIPMPGGMESLNAAVAGSLALFEVLRQRDNTNKGAR